MAGLADTAWAHVCRARRLILPTPGRIAATLAEHQAILRALGAHDVPAARLATQVHLGQLLRLIEPLADQRPALFAP